MELGEGEQMSPDQFSEVLGEYQTLIKQQKTFTMQLMRLINDEIYNKLDNQNVKQTILLNQIDSCLVKLMEPIIT